MGEVWLARRRTVGGAAKDVAVKLMRPRAGASATQMFVDEARLALLMRHPNIVQTLNAGCVGEQRFLEMEWVDGTSLADLSARLRDQGRRLPYEITAYIMRSVLRALTYLHAMPQPAGRTACVIHGDVTPHNLLLSASGEVKLTDFGIARVAGQSSSDRSTRGKLRYMAPEQFRGELADARLDLYTVGALLHELLSGGKFREGEALGRPLRSVPRLVDPNVPAVLEGLRCALLQPHAEHRPAAATALRVLEQDPLTGDRSAELAAICTRARTGSSGATALDTTAGLSGATEVARTEQTATWAPAALAELPIAIWQRPRDAKNFVFGMLVGWALFGLSGLAVALLR